MAARDANRLQVFDEVRLRVVETRIVPAQKGFHLPAVFETWLADQAGIERVSLFLANRQAAEIGVLRVDEIVELGKDNGTRNAQDGL